MEFKEVIVNRRSVRKYLEYKIPHETICEIIDMVRFSPSWENTQIPRFIYIEDKSLIEELSEKALKGFVPNIHTVNRAVGVMIETYVKGRCGREHEDLSFSTSKKDTWEMFDAGIYAQSFCLAAKSLGVGTCIIGYFEEDIVKEVLGIGDEFGIGAIIPMGYPIKDQKCPPRKEVSELVTFR